MKSFIKSLFMLTIFCAALAALVTPNPLHVNDRLVYVAGEVDQMLTPDTFVVNGEKIKIWGVTADMPEDEAAQIELVAAAISNGETSEAAAQQASAIAKEQTKVKMAGLIQADLHCIRKGDAVVDGAVVMSCYTQGLNDFATCLLGRNVVRPEDGIEKAKYNEVHKLAAQGKSGNWSRCN